METALYLDNNATTPLAMEAADAMREASLEFFGNPASQHRIGQAARRRLDQAREHIAELLKAKTSGMDPDRLIFTSGGTEANHLALVGMLANQRPAHLITSAIEHPSLLGPVAELERRGWSVTRIGASEGGVVDLEQLTESFRSDTALLSIMTANNETGVVQPIAEITALCAKRGIPVHTDAAQSMGKLTTRFSGDGLAALSFAAHKFHGPPGIGGLLVRSDVAISPQLYGGHQQGGIRPGTETVALAVGMETALAAWHREADSRTNHLETLRAEFESTIRQAIPAAVVVGANEKRIPNTSNIAFAGVDRQALFLALDMKGVACSTGSACASGSSEPSPVLKAMGLKNELLEGALRFSFSHLNTLEDGREAARRIINCCKQLCR